MNQQQTMNQQNNTLWANTGVDISLDSLSPRANRDKPSMPSMNQLQSSNTMMAPQQSQSYGGGQQQNSMNSLTRGMNNMQFQQQPQQQGFGGMQQPMRVGMAPMGGGMAPMGGVNTMNRMNNMQPQQQPMGGGMMMGGQMNNSNNFAQFKAS